MGSGYGNFARNRTDTKISFALSTSSKTISSHLLPYLTPSSTYAESLCELFRFREMNLQGHMNGTIVKMSQKNIFQTTDYQKKLSL